MTNHRISPFGRLRRPAGLIRWTRCYTTAWDATPSQVVAKRRFANVASEVGDRTQLPMSEFGRERPVRYRALDNGKQTLRWIRALAAFNPTKSSGNRRANP
jgi:hypothetical protein